MVVYKIIGIVFVFTVLVEIVDLFTLEREMHLESENEENFRSGEMCFFRSFYGEIAGIIVMRIQLLKYISLILLFFTRFNTYPIFWIFFIAFNNILSRRTVMSFFTLGEGQLRRISYSIKLMWIFVWCNLIFDLWRV